MRKTETIPFLFLLVIPWGCKDLYVSPYRSPITGYLVVEGYISGNTTTQFSLTRTIPLPGDTTLPTENGALVQIQASDGSVYPLAGQGKGMYASTSTLQLNTQLQYRLHIKTSGGDEYLSDYTPYKPAPPIDSINFIQNGDNSIQIYANTHDPADNTHYYQWSYQQTYEYHSAEVTDIEYETDSLPWHVVELTPAQQVFRCWLTGNSTNILLGNSTKLARDVIYEQPIKNIPPDDVQTSVLYYIKVCQYSLTLNGYNFLTQMAKNSESLGSIFDTQPTELTSNIHSLTTPAEEVIGWVSAGTVQVKDLYINRYQIRSLYSFACPIKDTVLKVDALQIPQLYGYGGWGYVDYGIGAPLSNYKSCLICTTRGGTNIEPSWWPN